MPLTLCSAFRAWLQCRFLQEAHHPPPQFPRPTVLTPSLAVLMRFTCPVLGPQAGQPQPAPAEEPGREDAHLEWSHRGTRKLVLSTQLSLSGWGLLSGRGWRTHRLVLWPEISRGRQRRPSAGVTGWSAGELAKVPGWVPPHLLLCPHGHQDL